MLLIYNDNMSQNYKLVYSFQETDEKDYKFHAECDEINKLETISITAKGVTTTSTTPSSGTSFTISVLPNIIDQGQLGDCVANAFYYCIMSQTNNNVNPSRLYLYANCRSIDFTPLNQDDGTTIRTACKAIYNYGVCKETVYPYIISNYVNLPPLNAYLAAKRFQTFTYLFISQTLTSIKSCLNTNNVPIVFGFMVYSSFMSNTVAKTGIVPVPNTQTETLQGGHCMCIVGYNDSTQTFLCANSWGTSWGNKGYCSIPYAYLTNPKLASDFCYTKFVY